MAQQSVRRDRKNQMNPPCSEHAYRVNVFSQEDATIVPTGTLFRRGKTGPSTS